MLEEASLCEYSEYPFIYWEWIKIFIQKI